MTDALRMRVRSVASRSEGYHIALAVALALSRLAVEPANEHAFVTTFLTRRIPLAYFAATTPFCLAPFSFLGTSVL